MFFMWVYGWSKRTQKIQKTQTQAKTTTIYNITATINNSNVTDCSQRQCAFLHTKCALPLLVLCVCSYQTIMLFICALMPCSCALFAFLHFKVAILHPFHHHHHHHHHHCQCKLVYARTEDAQRANGKLHHSLLTGQATKTTKYMGGLKSRQEVKNKND